MGLVSGLSSTFEPCAGGTTRPSRSAALRGRNRPGPSAAKAWSSRSGNRAIQASWIARASAASVAGPGFDS